MLLAIFLFPEVLPALKIDVDWYMLISLDKCMFRFLGNQYDHRIETEMATEAKSRNGFLFWLHILLNLSIDSRPLKHQHFSHRPIFTFFVPTVLEHPLHQVRNNRDHHGKRTGSNSTLNPSILHFAAALIQFRSRAS